MQKTKYSLLIILTLFGLTGSLFADHYVARNGQTPVSPYNTIETAASNIQDAVNAAVAGATIWVNDGTYTFSDSSVNLNVVYIDKPLILRGDSSDPAKVIINGAATYRGIHIKGLAESLVQIDSLTLTNCYSTAGAGIILTGKGAALISNCVIAGNHAEGTTTDHGGGALKVYDGNGIALLMTNCVIRGNTAKGSTSVYGGGLYVRNNGFISNCEISENETSGVGGGLYVRPPGNPEETIIQNCLIVSNTAATSGGGVRCIAASSLRNCLIAYNTAANYSGLELHDANCIIDNCTITRNHATASHGGFRSWSSSTLKMHNTIIYHNTANNKYPNIYPGTTDAEEYNNCCTLPLATSRGADGSDNIDDDPLFVDWENGNFRLQPDSPCINAGVDQTDWLADSLDLDGLSRIDRFSRKPDVGCYEFTPQGMLFRLK